MIEEARDAGREAIERALTASRPPGERRSARRDSATPRPTAAELARCIDHTILAPEATERDIGRVCLEARGAGCKSVCVHSAFVPVAAAALQGSETVVCSTVGFPLGAAASDVKAYEAAWAVARGAGEVDMVIAIGALKAGEDHRLWADVRAVRDAVGLDPVLKAILETGLLTDAEKALAAAIAVAAGADFVKTSTGFGHGGATVADVALLRRTVGPQVGIKASGGITTYDDACALLAAGADRLGASRTLAILAQARRSTEAGAGGPG